MPDRTPESSTSGPPRSAGTRPRSEPTRRDGRLSRRRLLDAAGRLLTAEARFTLADVAAEAGVATATAYRHFRSADDVSQAFIAGFVDDVEERVGARAGALSRNPEERLLELCRIWVDAVLEWGPALTHLRSPEGFLARRARGEPEMTRSLRHVEPTLADMLARATGRAPAGEELAYALALWNALADPREVLDQHGALGWSAARIAGRLHGSVVAATRRG